MAGEDKDFFGMSDEDFTKLGPSSLGSSEEASASSSASEEDNANNGDNGDNGENADDPNSGGDNSAAAGGVSGDDPDEAAKIAAEADADKAKEEDDETANLSDEELAKAKPPAGKEPAKDAADAGKEPDGKDKPKTPEAGKDAPVAEADKPKAVEQPTLSSKDMTQEQLATFYDSLIGKPIKANGRQIVLRNPQEVERLVQMGAGYGRKLQDMQPHLKTLRMLENNNLLDEGKLSYLIDLDKKNPDAIKKLIKDSGLDPLDLNMEDNADYRPTNHSVSDTEVAFAETLKEVATLPGGRETIQLINTTFDKTSKEAIWAQPELLSILQSQRENGLYDQITSEVERKKMLGEIAPNTPFLEAYKIAGDALVAANSLILPGSEKVTDPNPAASATPAQGKTDQQAGRVLGTRTAAPKSSAPNNDKAKAASSPQSSSRKAKETINPLDMADDEFMKNFKF